MTAGLKGRKMKRLTIIVVVAALAYSAYWFWSASIQKAAIESWFENRRNAGWAADYSALKVNGFPNRLDTTISSPRLGDPDTGVLWESPFLQLFRLTYKPTHLIAVAANQQTFATPKGELGVKTTDLRASLEMANLATWTPERLIIVAEGLDMASTTGWAIKSDVTQLSAEIASDTTYRIALDTRDLNATFPGWLDTSSDNAKIERLFVDADLTLSAPLNRHAVERARPQPKTIILNLAEIEWNGLKLAAAGTLDVTSAGTPIGLLTLKVRNWREMLAQERSQNRLSHKAINRIELTFALISGLSGNPKTLDLPFEFKNGQIWLGPLNLGSAPTIIIP